MSAELAPSDAAENAAKPKSSAPPEPVRKAPVREEPAAGSDEGNRVPAGHDDAAHAHHHGHARAGYEMDFSEVERFAKHFDDPKRDAWQRPDQVIQQLGLRPGDTVADLGAGTGYFSSRLSKAVGPKGKVIALDVEPNMVVYLNDRARREGLSNVEARRVPPDAPGLAPNSANRILIVNTWHHIGAREQYSKRLRETLVPGGFVLVVDFTLDSDIGPPKNHRLTPEQVASELAAGGLDAEVVQGEHLPKQYLVRGTRRK